VKLLTCPINGPRPLAEFMYGGELRACPEPQAMSDDAWAAYVFDRAGEPGIIKEWWWHTPSNTWFIAERDNVHDQVLQTYLYGCGGVK
jgi:sarcosine oxidase, subunit delta